MEFLESGTLETHELPEESYEIDEAPYLDIIDENGTDISAPTNITAQPEGKRLRISWEKPTQIECDRYLVNYTVLTLSVPKTFSEMSRARSNFCSYQATLRSYDQGISKYIFQIWIFIFHRLKSLVYKAKRRFPSNRPSWFAIWKVRSFGQNMRFFSCKTFFRTWPDSKFPRCRKKWTNERYQSYMVVDWDWPDDFINSDYTIKLQYYPGKVLNLRNIFAKNSLKYIFQAKNLMKDFIVNETKAIQYYRSQTDGNLMLSISGIYQRSILKVECWALMKLCVRLF